MLAQVSDEGKEVASKASAKARVNLQQKWVSVRHFVIYTTKSFELDCSQYLSEQLQVGATMDDSEIFRILSLDGRFAGKFILDVQGLYDSALDKQDVRGKLGGSGHEFLAKVIGVPDPAELRRLVFVVANNVTVLPPRSDSLFKNVWRRECHSLLHAWDILAKSEFDERLIEFVLVVAKENAFH